MNGVRGGAMVVLSVALVSACTGPGVPPSPSPTPEANELGAGEPSGRGAVDGITVEIWLDRSQVAVGDVAFALVRISNQGQRVVQRETNTCGTGPASTVVETADPMDRGRDWDGVAEAFKRDILSGAGMVEPDRSIVGRFGEARMRAPAPGGAAWACPAYSKIEPFAPGDSDEMLLAWTAEPHEGMALSPGHAIVRATFTAEDEEGGPGPLTVSAEAPITIMSPVGEPAPGLTLVDYVDAALSHPEFSAWLETVPQDRWINTHVIYWPTSEGGYPSRPPFDRFGGRPVVEIGVFVDNPPPRFESYSGVIIDRESAEVLAVRLNDQ